MKEIITSARNSTIKEIIKLRKSRERKKNDLIIVDGRQEIIMAKEAGLKIAALFYCPDLSGQSKQIEGVADNLIMSVISSVFKKISYRESPDGFLALVQPVYLRLTDIKLKKNPLIIILESLEKPGNLGAVLRSADAAGVDAVIIIDKKTDIYNPNVIRASLGAVFTKQVVVAETKETKQWLLKNKINVFATTPEAGKLYTEVDYRCPTAIIAGEEHRGLSKEWLGSGREKVKIPMQGEINSLNVSVSTAVILFEAVRQRKKT